MADHTATECTASAVHQFYRVTYYCYPNEKPPTNESICPFVSCTIGFHPCLILEYLLPVTVCTVTFHVNVRLNAFYYYFYFICILIYVFNEHMTDYFLFFFFLVGYLYSLLNHYNRLSVHCECFCKFISL